MCLLYNIMQSFDDAPDWKSAVLYAANCIQENASLKPIGALDGPYKTAIVYGTNRYTGVSPAQLAVDLFRQKLEDYDVKELGFGQSDNGFTWAMIVEFPMFTPRRPDEPLRAYRKRFYKLSALAEDGVGLMAQWVVEAYGVASRNAENGDDWETYKAAHGLLEPKDFWAYFDALRSENSKNKEGSRLETDSEAETITRHNQRCADLWERASRGRFICSNCHQRGFRLSESPGRKSLVICHSCGRSYPRDKNTSRLDTDSEAETITRHNQRCADLWDRASRGRFVCSNCHQRGFRLSESPGRRSLVICLSCGRSYPRDDE